MSQTDFRKTHPHLVGLSPEIGVCHDPKFVKYFLSTKSSFWMSFPEIRQTHAPEIRVNSSFFHPDSLEKHNKVFFGP